jgi:twitching motility protein PilT
MTTTSDDPGPMGTAVSSERGPALIPEVLPADAARHSHGHGAAPPTAPDQCRPLWDWLALGREAGASDLHLVPGAAPHLRIGGRLTPVADAPVLDGAETASLLEAFLHDRGCGEAWALFAYQRHDFELGLTLDGIGRLRLSLFFDRGSSGAAIRLVARDIPPLAALGLPRVTESLMRRAKGLWIFTGATGSGKSTTQAAILRAIIAEQPRRIITLEDPIEYMHEHGAGLVSQREIGLDTESFERGILSALREDPDIILVGEMRELEAIQQALRAAETGHLVLATLHTADAPGAIDRIIDVFPASQQAQVRVQLADVLLAVYAQQLVPSVVTAAPTMRELRGRVAAVEVLLGPMAELHAARARIREAGVGSLYQLMETHVQMGCQTMERALADLVRTGRITERAAREAAVKKETLSGLLAATSAAVPL